MKALQWESKAWPALRGWALGMALALAGVPAWLVVRERWLNDPVTNKQLFDTWYSQGFYRWLPFPEYFLIIFACIAFLWIVSFLMQRPAAELLEGWKRGSEAKEGREGVSKRQKIAAGVLGGLWMGVFPFLALAMGRTELTGYGYVSLCALFVGAWVLWDVPLGSMGKWLQAHWEFWLSILLAHGAVVGWILSVYTHKVPLWLATVTLVLTHLNLIRFRQRIRPVFWVVSLALLLSTLFINAWWYSVVGDEFAFFDNALWISKTWGETKKYLYYGNFVYGTHPFGGTILQAGFMSVFGQGSFGWRFSSLYFSAIALIFYDDFWRRFLSPRIALWSVVLLAASHYLMNFGKIGYNNLQGFLVIGLILWTSGWAVQSKRLVAFVAVGVAQALSFYTFNGALIGVPLAWLIFLLYDWPRKPYLPTVARWAVSGLTLGVIILPLLLQEKYWDTLLSVTAHTQMAETLQVYGSTTRFYEMSALQHLFGPLYLPNETHFVAVGMMDPLSGIFLVLGGVTLLWVFWQHPALRTFTLTLAYMSVALIGTSSGANPALTRIFFILPWLAVIAALGLAWMLAWLKVLGLSEKIRQGVLTVILSAIIGLNLWQAYPLSYARMGPYHTFQEYYLKTAQHIFTHSSDSRISLVMVNQINEYINSLRDLLNLYELPFRPEQIRQVYTRAGLDEDQVRSPYTLVIVSAELDATTERLTLALLQTTDKTPCTVLNDDGHPLFDLWVSPEMEDVCTYVITPPFEGWVNLLSSER